MPARLPSRLKELRGTARPDRQRNEPQPGVSESVPRTPAWLDPEAARFYRDTGRQLVDMRVMTPGDWNALALTAAAWGEYRTAYAVLAKDGQTYEARTEAGSVMHRPRPECRLAADAWRRVQQGLQQFGLTPASRGRLDIKPEEPEDDFDRFMLGKKPLEPRRRG
jgi:P27 family predicted phage terminase small subunit